MKVEALHLKSNVATQELKSLDRLLKPVVKYVI